jgi:ketosteroid isomerase-like protein
MTLPPAADAAVDVVRAAYGRYAAGDMPGMFELVAENLSWTYLNPADPNPRPQTCHGRHELAQALEGLARRGEDTIRVTELTPGTGGTVLAVIHMPGRDEHTAYLSGDRAYQVITVADGKITGLRDCRTFDEARAIAGLA